MNSQQKCVLVFLIGAIVSITNGIVAVANVLPDFSGYTQGAPKSDCGNFNGAVGSDSSILYGSAVETSLIQGCIDRCSANNDTCQGVGVLVSMNDQTINLGTYRTFCNPLWRNGPRGCTVSPGSGGVPTQNGAATYYSNNNYTGGLVCNPNSTKPISDGGQCWECYAGHGSCPTGTTCQNDGSCTAPPAPAAPTCTSSQCASATPKTPICDNGNCRACVTDGECSALGAGLVCQADGSCGPGCTSNSSCANPTPTCRSGHCKVCSSDGDCAGSTGGPFCDSTGSCTPKCSSDAQCGAGKKCVNGACQAKALTLCN